MNTFAARVPAAFAQLNRDRDRRLVAGVCAGLAGSARVDPTLVRLVFALLALAGGAGLAAYAGVWLALPAGANEMVSRRRRFLGVGLLVISLVLALRSVGIADAVLWPGVLIAVGVYHLQADHGDNHRRARKRRLLGIVLVFTGVALAVTTIPGSGARHAIIAPTGLVVTLCLVIGPWIWRLAQERDAERLARIRAQERADMAARVHDSVLQTLTLVQRSADDPKRVGALARRQERELRGWLYGSDADASRVTFRGALESALADVEELHGIRVEIVQTGDAPLDEHLEALVLAAREAAANAAVHAGVGEVSVFVEVADDEVALYVHDRGAGFDPAAVPADRHGLTESITGRLERAGGRATIRSTVGEGTEIELRVPREEAS